MNMLKSNAFVAGFVLLINPVVYGATIIPIDDFEHRDPALPGWTRADLSAGQPWGPGAYDPSSGALRIYHTGSELITPGAPFPETAMFLLRNDSNEPLYQNGYLRSKVRIDAPSGNASLEMRATLATGTAYILFGAAQPPASMPELDGHIRLQKFVNGVGTDMWLSDRELQLGEDWNLELGVVGNRVTAKAWKVGEMEPALPQYDAIDLEPIMGGHFAISADKVLGTTVETRADSTFDDIAFIAVPEPASLWLVLGGFVSLFFLGRK